MSRDDARAAESAIARLAGQLADDPRLHAEHQRARREFFGVGLTAGSAARGASDAAEQRFGEWLLLERESDRLGAVPADVPPFVGELRELAGSLAGVFLVVEPDDDVVVARDLQDEAMLELLVPAGSLQQGDLLVGRLFPSDDGQWLPSTAAAVFRPGAHLAEAFHRDVERLDLGRRLQQVELEHLLLRRTDQAGSPTAGGTEAPLEHLEANLDKLLRGSGHGAGEVSRELAAAVRPGLVIDPLLEELAFHTQVDLDAVRRLLLRIWNVHHQPGSPAAAPREAPPETPPDAPTGAPPEAGGDTLGERLVRTLDEGLRQKRDVEDVFAQLERMAGLEPGDADEAVNPYDEGQEEEEEEADDADEDDADGGNEATDTDSDVVAGDLDPLVQEYLWETGRESDPAAATLRLWVELQGNSPVPHTDLEAVTSLDLMRLLLHCYLGAGPAERRAAVSAAFSELQHFYDWAHRTQDLELTGVLAQCEGPFVDQLERLQAAGIALSTPPAPKLRPSILQIEDLDEGGFGVRDDDGDHHWLRAGRETTRSLRVGDLVLGALASSPGPKGGGNKVLAGLVVVLPADARTLIE